MRIRPFDRISFAPLLVLLTACGGDDARADGTLRIDTLADGTVRVANGAEGTWEGGAPWHVRETWRLGTVEGSGPEQFSEPAALEEDPLGRLYVLERRANEIRVFDGTGTHVRTVGRTGAGPGEIRQAAGFTWGPDGNLWVLDFGNGRFVAFDTTGAPAGVRSRAVNSMMVPWPGGFDRSGRLFDVVTTIDRTSLLRQATGGGPVDTVPLPHVEVEAYTLERDEGRVSMRMPVPFTPRLVWAVDPVGRLWAGAPGDYRITIHDDAGRAVRVVEKPHTSVRVSAAERSALPDQVEWFVNQGGTVDLGRVPATKPAYEDVYFDDLGYAWIRPHVADDAPGTALDIFDPEGVYIGRVSLPVTLTQYVPVLVRGDRITGVVLDDDNVPSVVRMRIEGRRMQR